MHKKHHALCFGNNTFHNTVRLKGIDATNRINQKMFDYILLPNNKFSIKIRSVISLHLKK